jgi:hypothetical protein
VSVHQYNAINKYTNWQARHFHAVDTFYSGGDIKPENYNRDEFVALIEESDVLHFCSADHKYDSTHKWGFDWEPLLKNKVTIFHDYNSFPGRWSERAAVRDFWNRRRDIGYDAIFSSIPQATQIYDGCVYIPDIVDERTELYRPNWSIRPFHRVVLGHFPTGGGNNKNGEELSEAVSWFAQNGRINLLIASDVKHEELIQLKQRTNLAFDCLWRGFHGMTTVENLALGIPTMTAIDGNFREVFAECFQTDKFPFEVTNSVGEIKQTVERYMADVDELMLRGYEVRWFMENIWSAENVAHRIVKQYENLLERK